MAAGKVPLILVVEGVIGVGKTTFLETLTNLLTSMGKKVRAVPEMVEEWKESGILEHFYTDQKRWAYTFQTIAFADLARSVRTAWEDGIRDGVDILLVERSPLSNSIFASVLFEDGFLTPMEWRHYESWANEWTRLFPITPSLFIYLTAPIDVCISRIAARGRPGEEKLSADYEGKLEVKHRKIFSGSTVLFGGIEVPLMTIDTTSSDLRTSDGVQIVLNNLPIEVS